MPFISGKHYADKVLLEAGRAPDEEESAPLMSLMKLRGKAMACPPGRKRGLKRKINLMEER